MKKFLLLLLILTGVAHPYEKKSIVERYTNYQCGPCATLNNSWYNQTVSDLLDSNSITHIVYNVNWPGPNDPMYLLNAVNNSTRWAYYGVNSVPWITVNGSTISSSQTALLDAVNNGNRLYSPFKIVLTPERFSNNVFNVNVKIYRDSTDNTNFSKTMLRVGITEKTVTSPPGGIEAVYYDITRRMLPNAKGTLVQIPEPGEFVEYDLQFVSDEQFLQAVNLSNLNVVALIQSDVTKEIYQSASAEIVLSNNLNAAFISSETLGATPIDISFTNYSTATDSSTITSWKWDFNDDGIIDSEVENPIYTFIGDSSFSVTLTVSDGINQHTRRFKDLVTLIGITSDILVVNGIHYATYPAEFANFYNNSAPFGDNLVDIWDLFGDQDFDYKANQNIQQVNLYNRTIPSSILNKYKKVIWIGNNYSGDLNFWDADQVLEYVRGGGNFLLATRWANAFLTGELKNYSGVSTVSGDQTIATIVALDDSLVDMSSLSANSFIHYVTLDTAGKAIPIFDNATTPDNWVAGFRLHKDDEGVFIFIAGRPYRYNNTASFQNYDYIIKNWMTASPPVNIQDNDLEIEGFELSQNFPNPFNPVTTINWTLPNNGIVTLKVYDMLGREISTLVNEFMQMGRHSVEFNAASLASGVYYYQLKSNNFTSTKKLLLLK
jgi:PKD repeat protein